MRLTHEQLAEIASRDMTAAWPCTCKAAEDIPALLAHIKVLEDENAWLLRHRDEDWTASLCDRVNEFLREHPICAEVDNGPACSAAITHLHGYTGSLKSALQGYATCHEGCTCGDGWSHSPAREVLGLPPY
jgi:hypothetical protein